MDIILATIKDNIWLVVSTVLLLFIVIMFIENGIKWLIVPVIIAGVVFYLNDPTALFYDKDVKAKEEALADQQAINLLLANRVNVVYSEGKNSSYTITTKDSVVYGTYLSKIVTVVANGRQVKLEATPELTEFIDFWRNEHNRVRDAAKPIGTPDEDN
jgi:hypothetical protein